MLFVIEFADGTSAQVETTSLRNAKLRAIDTFKNNLVVSVRQAGLLELIHRQSSPTQED
jgi:hypothetical protein